MNKKVIIGAVLGGGAVAAALGATRKGAPGERRAAKWDKMRQRMEEMPADFPPRVMFENIQAIRTNTDEMLRLMRQRSPEATEAEVTAEADDDIEIITTI